MSDPQQCSDPACFMPAVLLLADVGYCIADYKARNGGRV